MSTRRNHAVGKMAAAGLALMMLIAPLTTWAAAPIPAVQTISTTKEQQTAFTDVQTSYAKHAVNRLASLNLINGPGGDRFYPQQAISRQDIAVLLAKVAGVLPQERETAAFADVPADSPYAPYVHALAEIGLMKGRNKDTLGAAEPLTRQDLAVLLQRLMKISGSEPQDKGSTMYADEQEIAEYAREAVRDVTAKRWMLGASGKFHPRANVTRADAAVIAERLLDDRYMQAQRVDFAVNATKLSLLAGTSQRIEVTRPNGEALPFTPIFGFDRPELGTITPDGTFIAGPNNGTGQITVSVGYRKITIPVEITPNGTLEGKNEGESTTTESKPVEQEGLVNLAPDSFYAVRTTGPADSYFRELEKTYPGPVGGLIVPSDTWTGYSRQFGREVTLALPAKKQLRQISLTFKQDKKQGIILPENMEVELSRDGKAWFYAGEATHNVKPSDETAIVRTLSVSLPSVEARYVRVRFPVKVFVFARQLQVWGWEEREEAAAPVLLAPITRTGALEDKKAGDRMENMLLAYSGAHGERGTWTQQDFLPLVGYMSTDDKVLDRMFDTILFLPYPNLASTRDGWKYYMDDLFRPGRQLDALNDAMMEYNKRRGTLYTSPQRENVVLALPYPDPKQSSFGQILEDQDSLSFEAAKVGEERAYGYRKQALEWYFRNLLKRWGEAEYRYLRLEGIYWYHELIEDAVPRERQLIRETAEMVHNEALRFYWIPYFGATGLGEWKELGFDYAFVQPNFYNDKPIPIDRIEAALAVANKYGMGVEVEGDERMYRDPKFYQNYYNQLIAAHKLGIDKEKIHAYYYGSKTLLEAVTSKDPVSRAIYDDTYMWMRGRFSKEEYLLPTVQP
ncbi:DUF4855 domain-containing protein [Brevibacillus sp. H7]|uniref:DUF4855 domain-containing protein n=1 Tax=Brevibacillus sp. H7 TaxID=3349138 RepID=UPI00382915D2